MAGLAPQPAKLGRPQNPLFPGLKWRIAARLLSAVAAPALPPIYRGERPRLSGTGPCPQSPEKNRFLGDFCVWHARTPHL